VVVAFVRVLIGGYRVPVALRMMVSSSPPKQGKGLFKSGGVAPPFTD